MREFGHNEEEEHANEDPGVNSDNEEEDEFKVGKLLSIHQMQFYAISIIHPIVSYHHTTTSFLQFETISQPSPAVSISRREPGELSQFGRTQQEAPSVSSSRSSTLSRPNPPGTLSVSRTSSGRSRKEENQEWDAKLLGKPGMTKLRIKTFLHIVILVFSIDCARQGRCLRG